MDVSFGTGSSLPEDGLFTPSGLLRPIALWYAGRGKVGMAVLGRVGQRITLLSPEATDAEADAAGLQKTLCRWHR